LIFFFQIFFGQLLGSFWVVWADFGQILGSLGSFWAAFEKLLGSF